MDTQRKSCFKNMEAKIDLSKEMFNEWDTTQIVEWGSFSMFTKERSN
jgi:hypothetical protein